MDGNDINFHFRFDNNDNYESGFEREQLHKGTEEESDGSGDTFTFDARMEEEGNVDDSYEELQILESYLQEEYGRLNVENCPLNDTLL